MAFIVSKSRIVGSKTTTTIARLELQAALTAVRLSKLVEDEYEFNISRRVFWSDSQIVLYWIRKDPNQYKSFVANRLGKIREKSKTDEWRWVPSNENPADDATRFVQDAISNTSRWFQGPNFLNFDGSH